VADFEDACSSDEVIESFGCRWSLLRIFAVWLVCERLVKQVERRPMMP